MLGYEAIRTALGSQLAKERRKSAQMLANFRESTARIYRLPKLDQERNCAYN
jgi:hypothetical protein